MSRQRLIVVLVCLMLTWAAPAWSVGPQFNGDCNSISWLANNETDLSGYHLYDRVSLDSAQITLKIYGAQITSATCASLALNPGQHYLSLRAIDQSLNFSPPTVEIPFVIVTDNVVSDLRVTVINATDMTLAFTEVQDGSGTGTPATYDVRFNTPTMDWGTAASVTSGTCSTPVAGTTVGATKTCTVTGLATTTPYQFRLVPHSGTFGSGAVYGPLSNIASGTTGGTPPVSGDRYELASDMFTRANNVDLGPSWTPIISYPWQIVSNNIRKVGATAGHAVETHIATMPDDQWAEAVIQTITGSANLWVGVTVRASETEHTSYQCLAARGTGLGSDISKRINGTISTLATEGATSWASTDILRCEARGTTIDLYRNDVLTLSVVDTSLTSGKAGIWGYIEDSVIANMELASWSAGGFTASTGDECGCN